MKLKYGFISNSSTTSFVILGLDITGMSPEEVVKKFKPDCVPKYAGDWYEELYSLPYHVAIGSEQGIMNDASVIGKQISRDNECSELDCTEHDLFKLIDSMNDLCVLFGKNRYALKLYTGCRNS